MDILQLYVYSLIKKSTGTEITPEQIEEAVEKYLIKNPIDVKVDKTLTQSGMAADAKIAGEKISALKEDLVQLDSQLSKSITDITERKIETIPIVWTQTDEYYNSNSTISHSSYYYQFYTEVTKGDVYTIDGTTDGSKCLYATLDDDGNVVQKFFVATEFNVLHEGIIVTIGDDETRLVLQAKAGDRAKYNLKKATVTVLKKGSVHKDTLSVDVSSLFPTDLNVINLFDVDSDDIIIGKYINGANYVDNARFNVSGYIPVEQGKTYTFPCYPDYFGASVSARVYCYKADKSYYAFISGTINGKLLTVTISNINIAYIRFHYANGSVPTDVKSIYQNPMNIMCTETPYPTHRYYPYNVEKAFKDDVRVSNENMYNPLFGKSVVFTGDSICNGGSANDGKSGWAGRIGTKNYMMWKNAGISGATITSKTITGSTGTISETDFENADYIIIEGGTNDADMIGDAITGSPQNFGTYDIGDYTSDFNNDTYCGAIESLFKRVMIEHKNAKIGVIIAQKMGQIGKRYAPNTPDYTAEHNNRRKYFETLIELCKKWGIPYLNLWDGCNLNPMIPTQYEYGQASTEGKMYVDGQHLTSDGYDYVYTKIEAWMKTL